jgi:hypothetical protein
MLHGKHTARRIWEFVFSSRTELSLALFFDGIGHPATVRIPLMWMVDSGATWMVIPAMWKNGGKTLERNDAGIAIMPETFDIHQGVGFIIIHSFVSSSLWPALLACLHLLGDIRPVLSRYFLLDFLEETAEVTQAAYRCAASVVADSNVFTQGAPSKMGRSTWISEIPRR